MNYKPIGRKQMVLFVTYQLRFLEMSMAYCKEKKKVLNT